MTYDKSRSGCFLSVFELVVAVPVLFVQVMVGNLSAAAALSAKNLSKSLLVTDSWAPVYKIYEIIVKKIGFTVLWLLYTYEFLYTMRSKYDEWDTILVMKKYTDY